LLDRFKVRLERLRSFAMGDSKAYAPFTPILLLLRFSARLERLRSFSKGDNSS